MVTYRRTMIGIMGTSCAIRGRTGTRRHLLRDLDVVIESTRTTVVAVDLVDGAGEVTYVVDGAPPDTVRVPMPCAEEIAVGESIPSCVQEALSAAFAAEVAAADGPPIAFDSNRDGDFEIYTMRADGTDVRQLTANAAWAGGPAWSP